MNRIYRILEKVSSWFGTILLFALMLAGFSQVLIRNLFGVSFTLVEDGMRMAVLWIIFAGTILTTLHGNHISIDILSHFLPKKYMQILNPILNAIAGVFCLVLAWFGYKFIVLEMDFETMIAGKIAAWVPELIIPIGFVLISLSFFLRAFLKNNSNPGHR